MKKLLYLLPFALVVLCAWSFRRAAPPRPNILWITSEDNSPLLGCYGDTFATTPNLDKLAARGFRYTHAYANAPVCAPTRNTIITGVYANSGGNQHMRSQYAKSSAVHYSPEYLRAAGYYCTNNLKEDYNIDFAQIKNIWDESSKTAHYKNRKPGQPFFAVFNTEISHESSLHTTTPTNQLRHDPKKVKLPPYHPDAPEIRHDWAQYYDKVEDMDKRVGALLQELEESGEAENTIVFYYGDHGGVLARSKRFVYETGTRVPFIVHIPEKFKSLWPAEKPGAAVDRLISFVDLAPTLLSLIGTPKPDYMQGKAFLGNGKTPNPPYVYMFRDRMDERYDMCRAVRDPKYRYIRNYMPYRPHGQHLIYLWNQPAIRSWEAIYKAGQCNDVQSAFWKPKPVEELYDTENDPWEVNNLAGQPQYRTILTRMRAANRDWMLQIKDTGLVPEAELVDRTKKDAPYDLMRSGDASLKTWLDRADAASGATVGDLPNLTRWLKSADAVERYWAATGLLVLGDKAKPALPALREAAKDPSLNVAIVAAEALYRLGEQAAGRKPILTALTSPNQLARTHALNAIDCLDDETGETKAAVVAMVKKADLKERGKYDLRMTNWLFEKWNLKPETYGITPDWWR